MIFRIDPPKGHSSFADTAEEALRKASQSIGLPEGMYETALKSLQSGQTVRWAYGFCDVWITPVPYNPTAQK